MLILRRLFFFNKGILYKTWINSSFPLSADKTPTAALCLIGSTMVPERYGPKGVIGLNSPVLFEHR